MSDDHETDREAPIDEAKASTKPKRRKRPKASVLSDEPTLSNEERKLFAMRIGRFGTKPPEWDDDVFAYALFSTIYMFAKERSIPLVPVFLRTSAPDEAKEATRRWILEPFTSLHYSAQRASEAIAGVAAGSFHVLVLRESDRFVTAKGVTEAIGHEPSDEEIDNAKRAVASEVERLTNRIAKHVGVDSFMGEDLIPFAVSKARLGLILERIAADARDGDADGERRRSLLLEQVEADAREQAIEASADIDAIELEEIADPVDAPESIDATEAHYAPDPMEPGPGETKSFALSHELRVDAWTDRYAEAERDGMLELDAILFETIRGVGGDDAKHIADKEERDARARWGMRNAPSFAFRPNDSTTPGALWKRWVNPIDAEGCGFPFVGLLAEAAWLGIVRPQLEREAARYPAGLARVVASDQIIASMTRQLAIPELDDGAIRDKSGRVIGRITLTTDATIEAVHRGLVHFGTVAGHRLVRGLVHRAHDQKDAGVGDYRRVAFVGGMDALLDTLKLGPNYGDTIRDIAIAGQSIQWATPYAEGGGFWTWTQRRGSRKGPGEVAFVLGDPLLPGYVSALRSLPGSATATARINRRFVPELRGEVPIPASLDKTKHGPAWTLHRMMIVELVDHASEIATGGLATIPRSRILDLARLAGLPRAEDVDRVLDAFTNGAGEHSPIFRRDGDGWTLADGHVRERDYIAERGAAEISGKGRGKRGSAARLEGAPRPRKRRRREG